MKKQKKVFNNFSKKLLLMGSLIVSVIVNAQQSVSSFSGGTSGGAADASAFSTYVKNYGNMGMVVVLMFGCIHAAYKLIKPKEGQDNWSVVITFAGYILAVAVMAGLKAWIGAGFFN